jgi:hypothetical protein
MKFSKHLFLFAMLALMAPSLADSNQWPVRVEMQIVSIPTSTALQLVPALRDRRQIGSAFAGLQTKIDRGEATLIAWPIVWTTSGQRGESESMEELRYPTEFDPAQFTQNGARTIPRPSPRIPLPEGMPNAFETRNLGVTFEVSPVVSGDGASIDLRLDPRYIKCLGFRRYKLGKADSDAVGMLDQPEFFSARITTSMVVRSGEWKLIATFVVAKPEPHVELFLVRASAHSLGK